MLPVMGLTGRSAYMFVATQMTLSAVLRRGAALQAPDPQTLWPSLPIRLPHWVSTDGGTVRQSSLARRAKLL